MSEEKKLDDELLENVAGGLPKSKGERKEEPREPFGYAVGTIRKFKGLNMNLHQTWDYIESNWSEFVLDMGYLGFREASKEELHALLIEYWDQYDYA